MNWTPSTQAQSSDDVRTLLARCIEAAKAGGGGTAVDTGWLGLRGLVNSSRAARTGEYVYLLLFGDSWMDGSSGINEPTWASVFEEKIRVTFGSAWAGYGYVNAARAENVSYHRGVIVTCDNGANWTPIAYTSARGASPSHFSSSTAGAWVEWTIPAGTPVPTRMLLVYNQVSGGGSFKWRFNSDAWSADVSTNGTAAPQTLTISTGLPTTDGFTFRVEVVSGTVGISGLEHRCRTQGLLVHNLAVTGLTAAAWQTWNSSNNWGNAWSNGIVPATRKGLGAIMSLGANDMGSAGTAAFLASLQSAIDSVQVGFSDCQWGFIGQCEMDRDTVGGIGIRPTEYVPAMSGTLDNGNVGAWAGQLVPCFDGNDWFGNMDQTAAIAFMNGGTPGARYHLNRRGAGVFADGVCRLLGI